MHIYVCVWERLSRGPPYIYYEVYNNMIPIRSTFSLSAPLSVTPLLRSRNYYIHGLYVLPRYNVYARASQRDLKMGKKKFTNKHHRVKKTKIFFFHFWRLRAYDDDIYVGPPGGPVKRLVECVCISSPFNIFSGVVLRLVVGRAGRAIIATWSRGRAVAPKPVVCFSFSFTFLHSSSALNGIVVLARRTRRDLCVQTNWYTTIVYYTHFRIIRN